MALKGMAQANLVLGLLQETKLTDGFYTYGSAGLYHGRVVEFYQA